MIPSGLVMVQNIPITKVITTCLFSFIFCGELKSSSSAFVNAKRHGGGSIVIDDRNHNIFWFMQITDLHLSKFGHKDRGEDLREFCSTHIPVIQPELVIASGDITDGKSSIIPGSSQHIEEWENYKSVLVNSGVLKLTKWFDIRGNHGKLFNLFLILFQMLLTYPHRGMHVIITVSLVSRANHQQSRTYSKFQSHMVNTHL
ncbi:unnamed protein product [Heterobilharzia americana]|nr:unnamed protein product [Heterobilharzia americana]